MTDRDALAAALNSAVGSGWLRLTPSDPVAEWRENAAVVAAAITSAGLSIITTADWERAQRIEAAARAVIASEYALRKALEPTP